MKLKLSRRRAYFLDGEPCATRLRVLKVVHPQIDKSLDVLLWGRYLCVTNVSRTGETLDKYEARCSIEPHFTSIKALRNVECYGLLSHIGMAEEDDIGEL